MAVPSRFPVLETRTSSASIRMRKFYLICLFTFVVFIAFVTKAISRRGRKAVIVPSSPNKQQRPPLESEASHVKINVNEEPGPLSLNEVKEEESLPKTAELPHVIDPPDMETCPVMELQATTPGKPVWMGGYPGSGFWILEKMIPKLTGLEALSVYYHKTCIPIADNQQHLTNTAVCVTHWPFIARDRPQVVEAAYPEDAKDKYYSKSLLVLRNPRYAIPSYYTRWYGNQHRIHRNHEQPPASEWMKWRDARLEQHLRAWKQSILSWHDGIINTSVSQGVGMYLPYEDLSNPRNGPVLTQMLTEFLQTSGHPTILGRNQRQPRLLGLFRSKGQTEFVHENSDIVKEGTAHINTELFDSANNTENSNQDENYKDSQDITGLGSKDKSSNNSNSTSANDFEASHSKYMTLYDGNTMEGDADSFSNNNHDEIDSVQTRGGIDGFNRENYNEESHINNIAIENDEYNRSNKNEHQIRTNTSGDGIYVYDSNDDDSQERNNNYGNFEKSYSTSTSSHDKSQNINSNNSAKNDREGYNWDSNNQDVIHYSRIDIGDNGARSEEKDNDESQAKWENVGSDEQNDIYDSEVTRENRNDETEEDSRLNEMDNESHDDALSEPEHDKADSTKHDYPNDDGDKKMSTSNLSRSPLVVDLSIDDHYTNVNTDIDCIWHEVVQPGKHKKEYEFTYTVQQKKMLLETVDQLLLRYSTSTKLSSKTSNKPNDILVSLLEMYRADIDTNLIPEDQ